MNEQGLPKGVVPLVEGYVSMADMTPSTEEYMISVEERRAALEPFFIAPSELNGDGEIVAQQEAIREEFGETGVTFSRLFKEELDWLNDPTNLDEPDEAQQISVLNDLYFAAAEVGLLT